MNKNKVTLRHIIVVHRKPVKEKDFTAAAGGVRTEQFPSQVHRRSTSDCNPSQGNQKVMDDNLKGLEENNRHIEFYTH